MSKWHSLRQTVVTTSLASCRKLNWSLNVAKYHLVTPVRMSRQAARQSGRRTTVLSSVELAFSCGFALPRNSRAPAVAQPYDSCYLLSFCRHLTPMPNTMSLLNRLLPNTRSCDIAIWVMVLLLDQIDVVNMHTVARDVRDMVSAFRVSRASRFYSLRHRNGLLRQHGRMFGARAHYCVYLTQ
jgi:hypothetical protein